jgi:hypothetical protein
MPRQPEFVRFDDKVAGLIRFDPWQNPPRLPYGNAALQ